MKQLPVFTELDHSLVFFTIIAKNYLAYARTLSDSISLYYPNCKIFVAIADSVEGIDLYEEDNFEIITLKNLQLPNEQWFIFRYNVLEFCTAIKPYVFQWLFKNTSSQGAIYLDPDIFILSPLTDVVNLLKQGATAVLTPHITAPLLDGYNPDDKTFLQTGVYNCGFIAISHTEEGRKLTDWWAQRLEHHAHVDFEGGLFTDQKWADLMPSLFNGVAILRSPGYNVAYWNLMQRNVTHEQGRWYANGELISFVHFSGIEPQNPSRFSKYQNRYTANNIGALQNIYNQYLARLKANKYNKTAGIPYGFGCLIDGTAIHPAMRSYGSKILEVHGEISHPFKELTEKYFNTLEPKIPNNRLITRFMYGLYFRDRDSHLNFNLELPAHQLAFAKKFILIAQKYAVPPIFLNVAQQYLTRKNHHNPSDLSFAIKKGLAFLAYKLYRKNPSLAICVSKIFPARAIHTLRLHSNYINKSSPSSLNIKSSLESFIHNTLHRIKKTYSSSIVKTSLSNSSNGVTLIGYAYGDFGLSQNLRYCAKSLLANQVPFDIIDFSNYGSHYKTDLSVADWVVESSDHPITLFCLNADQMERTDNTLKKTSYRIGYWFWELSKFPNDWMHAFKYVDEIWAPSRFIFECLLKISKKPITYMPIAINFTVKNNGISKSHFQLDEKNFLILFSYDFFSFIHRKNPMAALQAFLHAFPEKTEKVTLVIKTINSEKNLKDLVELLEFAQQDKRIRIINQALSRDDMFSLLNLCDSYVSLHRSEGFGLGLAEAMFLGKPVIGTGYSGNLDFMNQDNSCLVNYTLGPVPPNHYLHWEGQEWANPDIEHTAYYMRKLYQDTEYRERIGKKGQEWIHREHSPEKIGALMKNRLERIRKTLSKT